MPEIQTNNLVDRGQLKIQVTSRQRAVPIPNATIEISYTGDPDSVLETVSTDEIGQTPVVDLPAPPVEYSMSPSENQPYSEYNLKIHSDEYKPVTISGAQILSGVEGLQPVSMIPEETHTPTEEHPIVIGPHTLWGNYPPKIAESEIKPVNESGEIVLSRVVIPEYIIVHDGPVGCDFHQPPGAWEKMVQEIGPQAVADYRNVVEVYKVRQDIHFLRGKELCLVYQNCVYFFPMIQIFCAVCIPDLGNLF